MGQEQSLAEHPNAAPLRHYHNQERHRAPSLHSPSYHYERKEYTHIPRRSIDSFKSDHSSSESSGYRSGSSAYERRSDRSSKSDHYCVPLYRNDHYIEVNKELYKPVKIAKDKRCKLQLFDADIKSTRLKGYLGDTGKAKLKEDPTPKRAGIRNYTPKIISAEEQSKKIDNWI